MSIINGVGRVGIRNYVPINNPLWNNLLAYYTGDDTPNDAKGIYNGTLVNGATYSTGKINNGFNFDGVNDYVSISPTFGSSFSSPTSAHTYSAWIYPTSVTGYNWIIQNGLNNSGTSMILNGDKLCFFIQGGNNQTTSSATLPINTWSMVTVVYNGAGSVSFYKNGVLINSSGASWTETVAGTNTYIGSYVGAAHFFDGKIDEVGAWSRALTAAEVSELYNAGAGKQYISPTPLWVGLTAYYTGDDTANDSTGVYSGTLVNGATYATGKIGSSFSFDGINDYMSTATNSPINSSLPHTYSCWVKASSNSGTKILMGNGTSMIGFRGGNNLTFFQYYVNAESNSNYSLAINTWYHISVVYKGTSFGANNVLFYVNGSLVYTGSLSMPSGVGKIYLGSNNAGSGGFYGGLIDEAGAWNRALTSAEVTELYNTGAGKQYINQ